MPPAAGKIEHDFSGMLQGFPNHAGKRGGLIAVHDAALAMNDDDVAGAAGFQTELHVRLRMISRARGRG
jgi:hypothetical protein